MLHTTFKLLKQANACEPNYRDFAKALGGVKSYGEDAPIPLTKVLEINGLDDAHWALRCVLPEEEGKRDRLSRLLTADYAEHVLHLFEAKFPNDNRPRVVIETARRFARGEATKEELWAAGEAAWAARAAAWEAAREAAGAAAGEAAWAARAAAWEVAGAPASAAAGAVRAAAWEVARAARAAEREWQTKHLREMLEAENI